MTVDCFQILKSIDAVANLLMKDKHYYDARQVFILGSKLENIMKANGIMEVVKSEKFEI